MLLKKSMIQSAITLMLIVAFSFSGMAQMPMQAPATAEPANYSDAELKQFANAVHQVLVIQETSQDDMVETIESTELSVDRFNEMLMEGQQQGQDQINATEEELAAFTRAINQVQQLQQEMQMAMMQAISSQGLEVDQYQAMMQAYEQNPQIKEKVDQFFAELE